MNSTPLSEPSTFPLTPALSRLEVELNGLYDCLPLAFVLVDENLRCVRLSRRWRELAGLPPAAGPGLPLTDAMPGLGPHLAAAAESLLRGGGESAEASLGPSVGQTQDVCGEWRLQCRRIANEEGGLAGLVVMLREVPVSRRRWAEFLGGLVHDLRNDLSPLRVSGHLLRKAADRPELLATAIDGLDRQTRRMSEFLANLADLSRIGRGLLELRSDEQLLRGLLDRAMAAVREDLEKQGVALRVESIEPGLHVRVDPQRLTQAVERVLADAARRVPRGGSVHLRAYADGMEACIVVDCERTVPEIANPAALFDIFKPRDSAEAGGRSAIDLPLARELLRLQDGELVASRTGGGGLEYRLRLPRTVGAL